jgi:hypothetical protein
MKRRQSLIPPIMAREWIKSNRSSGTQSASMLSTLKLQFGGTAVGCMGLKSTPKTVALGFSSANCMAH